MIIMALDHTRDFFHITALIADPLDPSVTSVPLYFTRWITHFCAPVFVLLSGVSAYLSAQKKTRNEASLFLIKRGLWLIIMEITLVTLAITFNPFFNFILLQVIWAIGFSMIILGLLSRISYSAVLITGLVIFFGHNLLNYVRLPQSGTAGNLWRIFFTAPVIIPIGDNHFIGAFYAVLPWTAVMLLGYCLGYFYQKGFAAKKRKRFLLFSGLALILLFFILRFINEYGNPLPWRRQEGFMADLLAFLNTSKYPPSLQFLSMILGPALIVPAWLGNIKSKWTEIVSVYGRVPFFYFLLHFYILHTLLVIVFFATGHTTSQITDPSSFILFRPVNRGFGLPVVYLIWIAVVVALYYPCRWFHRYKRQHNYWWLNYL